MTEPKPIYNVYDDKISASPTWVIDQQMAELATRIGNLQADYDKAYMLRQEIAKAQKDVKNGKD